VRVVLDASAALVLATSDAFGSLRDVVASAEWVGAPDLFDYEVTNAVSKYHRHAGWGDDLCGRVLERALDMVDDRAAGRDLAVEALALARRLGHPSYDMFYVALARRRDALLATTDSKLLAMSKRLGVRVDPKLARA
jgi:predicted nucleic acid-binding protein